MTGALHLPVNWEIDTIADTCAKLTKLTGRNFKPDMLKAAYSGELPADGCVALLDGSGGNLEHARALGVEASVDWDDVADWLRRRGYTVARGKWIKFAWALKRLKARLSPDPTAAELETWALADSLPAYVDADSRRHYQCNEELLGNPHPDERRASLWFDSVDVDTFEPETRWLTVEQLAQRWGESALEVTANLRAFSYGFVIYWTNGDCPPVSSTDQAFEAAVVALEHVKTLEQTQRWTPAETPAAVPFVGGDGSTSVAAAGRRGADATNAGMKESATFAEQRAAKLWCKDPAARMGDVCADIVGEIRRLGMFCPAREAKVREWLKEAGKAGRLIIPPGASRPGRSRKD